MGSMHQRFHEHVLRVAGAQFLARSGLEVLLIQLFARWGGSSVLRYIQDAPLHNQQGIAPRAAAAMSATQQSRIAMTSSTVSKDTLKAVLRDIRAEIGDVSATLQANLHTIVNEAVRDHLASVSPAPEGDNSCVINDESAKLHVILIGPANKDVPAHDYLSICGWRFGLRPHTLAGPSSKGKPCASCFRGFDSDSEQGIRASSDLRAG